MPRLLKCGPIRDSYRFTATRVAFRVCQWHPTRLYIPHIRTLHTSTDDAKPSDHVVSLRKDLKDEAKQRRLQRKSSGGKGNGGPNLDEWELTVGIEIHAELNTARKLFSTASTSTNAEPNSNIALFDLAYPGAQPHFQTATLIPALRAAIALNCDIQKKSTFDRKHYFYQDQPAGYQITQYYGTNPGHFGLNCAHNLHRTLR
jgi:aspartyl-tRNA(Asn)/glutamyl-tRNA(Gln) amidotransferase subunit B